MNYSYTNDYNNFNVFNDVKIRRNFVNKILSIVLAQLITTTVLVLLFKSSYMILNFLIENMYVFVVLDLILILLISFNSKLLKNSNYCYHILFAFTLFTSINLSIFLSVFSNSQILTGFISTIVIVGGLVAFSFSSRYNFTTINTLKQITILSFINLIISLFFNFNIFVSLLSGIIFGGYLLYDMQKILGNKDNKYSIDDYAFAALNLYIDIINIFIEIMKIIKSLEDDNDRKKKR